jgi:aspartate-semialdehyde dehydrogenase
MAYKYPIHQNAIPQCDEFEDNGYTKEEMKLTRTDSLKAKAFDMFMIT